MIFPIITASAAAVLALLQTYLMLSVGMTRLRTGIGIGDGDQEPLALLIRRHGNLTENAPIFLIVLGLLEVAGGVSWAITTLASTFIVARLAHALALSQTAGPHPLRALGAFGTVLSIVATSAYLLWLAASG